MRPTTTIKIGKIEIAVSGLSSERIESSFSGFDRELQMRARAILKDNSNIIYQSDEINAGCLNVNQNIHPAHLRKIVAEKVLNSIVRERL